MERVWWIAIAALCVADAFFFHCAKPTVKWRWWLMVPGSGFVACGMLLYREYSERYCR